jgi:hypothetical protein
VIGKILGVSQLLYSGTAGENLSQYDPVYLASDGMYYKTRSDLMDTSHVIVAMAAASITAATSGLFYRANQRITNNAWSFTPGLAVYLDLYGNMTQVMPERLFSPAMTANNSPSPLVASADSEYSGHEAFKAFDDSVETYWSPSSGTTGWLKLDLGVGRTMHYYAITKYDTGNEPTAWTLNGSNDDSDYTTLDTQTGITWVPDTHSYLIGVPASYRYYKLTVSAANGSGPFKVAELVFTLNDNNLQIIGHAIDATSLWFNPNLLYVGVT